MAVGFPLRSGEGLRWGVWPHAKPQRTQRWLRTVLASRACHLRSGGIEMGRVASRKVAKDAKVAADGSGQPGFPPAQRGD